MNSPTKMTLLGVASTLILGAGYYGYAQNDQTVKEKVKADSIKKNTLTEYVEFRRQVENALHDQPKKADDVAVAISGQFNDKHEETRIRLYRDFHGDQKIIVIAETAYLPGKKYELRKDTLAINTLK